MIQRYSEHVCGPWCDTCCYSHEMVKSGSGDFVKLSDVVDYLRTMAINIPEGTYLSDPPQKKPIPYKDAFA